MTLIRLVLPAKPNPIFLENTRISLRITIRCNSYEMAFSLLINLELASKDVDLRVWLAPNIRNPTGKVIPAIKKSTTASMGQRPSLPSPRMLRVFIT